MYISIDVGGTNTRVAKTVSLDDPGLETVFQRPNSGSFDKDIDYIIMSIEKLLGDKPVEAICIGVAGDPDKHKTRLVSSPNLNYWESQPFVSILTHSFGCPVVYDNDAVVAGSSEAEYGYGKESEDGFDYLIWGTGVGGARFTKADNKKYYGEMLDWKSDFSEWESVSGGRSLESKVYRKPTKELSDEEWSRVDDVFMSRLSQYIEMNSPKAIVMGGGLASFREKSIQRLNETIDIPVVVSSFRDEAGLVGGLAMIKNQIYI
jgi:predicted NBD/HSP70 family sugar kinase